jgi:cobalt-zinc-cadmium efflux system protein
MNNENNSERNIITAFILNLLFAVIELVGGLITNSVAILSDAIHDFGDSLSLGVALYLQKVSKKRGDDKYTYGYRRFSLLGSVFISIILLFGSLYMIKESLIRLFHPQEANADGMMILSVLGIIVNGIAVLKLRKGSTHNERAVTLHMMEDVLGWVAVLIGSIVMKYTEIFYIDPILSILIAIWILFNVYRNLRETLSIMLQHSPVSVNISLIEKQLRGIEGIVDIADLHIWTMDGEKNVSSLHVIIKDNVDQYIIKNEIRGIFEKFLIGHSTIEFDMESNIDKSLGSEECR